MPKDYYQTLGISKTASQDEVKKAYRKLAHKYHPDKGTGDEAKFKDINEAYQVLSDDKKRSNYDTYGSADFNGAGFGGGSGDSANFWDFFGGNRGQYTQGGGMEDIFDMFSGAFGGNYGQPQYEENAKGEDLYLEVKINHKDLGQAKTYEYEVMGKCNECNGTRVAPGSKMLTCKTCNGNGQVRQTSRTPFGSFSRVGICPECRGQGHLPEKECQNCKATGRVKVRKRIDIHLPNDLEDNYTVLVPKGGNIGKSARPSGDLVINIKLK